VTAFSEYFLLILDKVTKYWANYPRKPRGTGIPVELLKKYMTTTERMPRYLRIDNAKEFTSQEMVNFCSENDIILQPVGAHNHTMQCRVEGAIGCSNHRVALCQAIHNIYDI